VPSGSVMVDGSKSIEDAVIRDRRELSSQGLVVAVITVDKGSGRQIAPVELISRGFVYMKESDELMSEAAEAIAPEIRRFETEGKEKYGDIKADLKSKLKSFFKSRTKRTPLIIPIVIEGEDHD
ncbi:MAG: ribonuclease J, partial [Firmicutes bacterium]|nr:ribonuclease J [Bacillota bacterium]